MRNKLAKLQGVHLFSPFRMIGQYLSTGIGSSRGLARIRSIRIGGEIHDVLPHQSEPAVPSTKTVQRVGHFISLEPSEGAGAGHKAATERKRSAARLPPAPTVRKGCIVARIGAFNERTTRTSVNAEAIAGRGR